MDAAAASECNAEGRASLGSGRGCAQVVSTPSASTAARRKTTAMKRPASDAFEVVRELDTSGNEVAMAANMRIVVPSATGDVPISAPHVPGEPSRHALTPLERIAQEVECAAADGNMLLVRERLQAMLQSCSLAVATSARRRGKGCGDDNDAKRSPGGFEYRPEYLLLVVILADRLQPGMIHGSVFQCPVHHMIFDVNLSSQLSLRHDAGDVQETLLMWGSHSPTLLAC